MQTCFNSWFLFRQLLESLSRSWVSNLIECTKFWQLYNYTKISTFIIFMTFYFFSSLKTRFGFVSYSKDVDFEDFLFFVKHLLWLNNCPWKCAKELFPPTGVFSAIFSKDLQIAEAYLESTRIYMMELVCPFSRQP